MSVTRNAAIAYVSSVRDIQELQHKDDQHTVPEWLIIARRQLQKVEDAWYEGKFNESLHRLAHVAACSIAAIEQNGQAPNPKGEEVDDAGKLLPMSTIPRVERFAADNFGDFEAMTGLAERLEERCAELSKHWVVDRAEIARLARRDSFDLQGINRVIVDQTKAIRAERDTHAAVAKNLHRVICEAAGYVHDEEEWRRDQASLANHVAALVTERNAVLKMWKACPGVTLTQAAKDMLEVATHAQKWAKENEADKARLDWLDLKKRESDFGEMKAVWDNADCYLREAIDAARASESSAEAFERFQKGEMP